MADRPSSRATKKAWIEYAERLEAEVDAKAAPAPAAPAPAAAAEPVDVLEVRKLRTESAERYQRIATLEGQLAIALERLSSLGVIP